jgi:hypothetical protein
MSVQITEQISYDMSSPAGSGNSTIYSSLILGFHNESLMMLLLFLGDDAMWNWADL